MIDVVNLSSKQSVSIQQFPVFIINLPSKYYCDNFTEKNIIFQIQTVFNESQIFKIKCNRIVQCNELGNYVNPKFAKLGIFNLQIWQNIRIRQF